MEHKEGLNYQMQSSRKSKRYATKERMAKVNPKNIKIYERYLRSRETANSDVKDTTYKVYKSYMNQFMCYIAENEDNFYLLDEDALEDDFVDIMEGWMSFCENTLGNGKKIINTKLSAVSSFYIWAVKRDKIKAHPFANKLDRIKGAGNEKRISVYFLHQPEIDKIKARLHESHDKDNRYDRQDELIWNIAFDSACRIGALSRLTVSSLDLEKNCFQDIREKEGKIVAIPFMDDTKEMIIEYLKWREEQGIDGDEFFYIKSHGQYQAMSKQSISVRIRKIGEIIGIGDFRAHCIRKSRLNQIGQTGNIELAKELAHHESLDTTTKFYMEKKDASETLKEISELMKKK